MIFTTGGRASGATSTRSRPRSTAAASASSTVITPSCAPSGAITRSGLIRICRFTRMRGALLFVLSIARCRSPPQRRKKKRIPVAMESALRQPSSAIRRPQPRTRDTGRRSSNPRALSRAPERQRVRRTQRPLAVLSRLSLARAERVHKSERLTLASQPARYHRGIVLEAQQPPLGLRSRVQPALRLERDQRLQVVPHDPGERQVRGRRHEIREEAGPLARALHQDRLVIGNVPRRRQAADPGKRLGVARYERERDGLEIGRQIARRRALVRVARELKLRSLYHIGGAG